MADSYRFPVFFECPSSLSKNEEKKVESYFSVRRRSGGGDCTLTRVDDHSYRISFRHQTDQQQVLKKSEHVVKLAEGRLVFSVSDDLPTPASSPNTTPTAPAEIPQFIPDSTTSPSKEEHELDDPLPSELKECLDADGQQEEELEKQVAKRRSY
ncbi:E3 ubiquitin-protein ligase DTX3L [Nematolebias whitei]|uniref:E3 ubiquitin-protein ligase DTX3L n=1 Tax=Nematolebias whitei TaxID=451745 RepID=UPI00189915C8|nr:E3 ubiquitin-protein ligase DTX3L [Nematolebias whitei]